MPQHQKGKTAVATNTAGYFGRLSEKFALLKTEYLIESNLLSCHGFFYFISSFLKTVSTVSCLKLSLYMEL